MSIVGGLDVHRRQVTLDYVDTVPPVTAASRGGPGAGPLPDRRVDGQTRWRCESSCQPQLAGQGRRERQPSYRPGEATPRRMIVHDPAPHLARRRLVC